MSAAEPEPPVRYLTEAECRQEFRLYALLTVHIYLFAIAFHILMRNSGSFGGFGIFLISTPFITRDSYRRWKRVQKGELLPVPAKSAPQPTMSRFGQAAVEATFVVVLTGLYVWLSYRCLSTLLHPAHLIQDWAAVYLLVMCNLVYGSLCKAMWRDSRKRHRRQARQPAATTAAAVAPSVAEPSMVAIPEPAARRHWWTDTNTRDEIQQKQTSGQR